MGSVEISHYDVMKVMINILKEDKKINVLMFLFPGRRLIITEIACEISLYAVCCDVLMF